MNRKININREHLEQKTNKRKRLEASVLIDARSPINAVSLLKAAVSRSLY